MPLGIENDALSGGRRFLFHTGGTTFCDWQHPRPPFELPGSWVNVDSRLGAVMVTGAGLGYVQASAYHPQMAVYPDTLCTSFSTQTRKFKAGEEVAHRTALLFVEVSPPKTATLARTFNFETGQNGRVLRFRLPEGGTGVVPAL